MEPVLLIGGLMLTQTFAIWVLVAAGWKLPLPAWLFPVTGRWRLYLAWGYLVLTFTGPMLVTLAFPEPGPARGMGIPSDSVPAMWFVVDVLWLAFSGVLVSAISVMVDLCLGG